MNRIELVCYVYLNCSRHRLDEVLDRGCFLRLGGGRIVEDRSKLLALGRCHRSPHVGEWTAASVDALTDDACRVDNGYDGSDSESGAHD